MARLSRLVLPGQVHAVRQAVVQGTQAFVEEEDCVQYLLHLRAVAAEQAVRVHAFALGPDAVQLLLTPPTAAALSQLMQGIGRRYVPWFNRRHARQGGLFAGRFRAAPVQPGAWVLDVQRLCEQAGGPAGREPPSPVCNSAAHHLGQIQQGWLQATAAYWALGNTPFAREAAYQSLWNEPLPPARVQAIRTAVSGCWWLGDSSGSPPQQGRPGAAEIPSRPLAPRPRGRPRRAPGAEPGA